MTLAYMCDVAGIILEFFNCDERCQTPEKILTSETCFLCKKKVSSEEKIKVFGKSAVAMHSLIQNKSQGFLLILIEPIKQENFANFPECTVLHYLIRTCESSACDFSVLLLWICKLKCDWSIRADVTEIVLWLEFADRIFRRTQAIAGNTSPFAG